jgi:hypothetical protein
MYTWAGEKGVGFDRYVDHEVGYWPQHVPDFGGREFDAVFSANFLEHIDNPIQFVQWAVSRLSANGRIYLEWPRPASINLPSSLELAEVGVDVMAGKYHDDHTHPPQPPSLEAVRACLIETGLEIRETGVVSVPFIDQQLAIHARQRRALVAMTLAYWSHTGWCQYIVAKLP